MGDPGMRTRGALGVGMPSLDMQCLRRHKNGTYGVYVYIESKQQHVGSYSTYGQAIHARDEARRLVKLKRKQDNQEDMRNIRKTAKGFFQVRMCIHGHSETIGTYDCYPSALVARDTAAARQLEAATARKQTEKLHRLDAEAAVLAERKRRADERDVVKVQVAGAAERLRKQRIYEARKKREAALASATEAKARKVKPRSFNLMDYDPASLR